MFGQTLISSGFLGGGWTNPAEKYATVKLDHFPKDRGEHIKNIWNHHLGPRCLNQSIWEHEDAAAEISLWFHLSILVGFWGICNPYITVFHI